MYVGTYIPNEYVMYVSISEIKELHMYVCSIPKTSG